MEEVIKMFYEETGKQLTVDAGSDSVHYSIDYINWLEDKLVKKLNITLVSKSF